MTTLRKYSRHTFSILIAGLLLAGLVFSFWPRAVGVDLAQVTRGNMVVTINEEGRTRVHDAYILSTPVAGRLMRVEVEPGDLVTKGKTIVAQMLPANPSALDIRTKEQAQAAVNAAQAALRVARADLNKAIADLDYANSELRRNQALKSTRTVSLARMEQAEREARRAQAAHDTATAAISVREAELANAQARLISFDNPGHSAAGGEEKPIPLYAPITGRILNLSQKSETTLPVGSSIMEIGNIETDLEIILEMLSEDAVKVSVGDRVIIDNWGGADSLSGVVERIDPWGFKKFSSLGVEEQRVNVIVRFTDPFEKREKLGHGYRVEARIVVWERKDALLVPSSALFRQGKDWFVFAVVDGKAEAQQVSIGRNNGVKAELLSGLKKDDTVILYPSSSIREGLKVKQRALD